MKRSSIPLIASVPALAVGWTSLIADIGMPWLALTSFSTSMALTIAHAIMENGKRD